MIVPLLVLCTVVGTAPAPPESPSKSDLRVLYLGAVPSERATAYGDYLREHFADVVVADRDSFDPAGVERDRVVLLDWSQSEIDIMKMGEIRSPLGAREAWRNPTVLLGSAGLIIAGPWRLTGGSG